MKTYLRNLTLVLLVVSAVTVPRIARAESGHDEDVHFAAHFGTSFAINTFLYAFNKRALHLEKKDALIFSAFETLTIGIVYKFLEPKATSQQILTSTWQNATGIIGSVIVIDIGSF